MAQHVTFRASPALLRRIDGLAADRKLSRTAVIRAAILEATVPEHATGIADEREVLLLLTEAARGGSVAAMKVLLAHHRLPGPAAVDPIFQELDELAGRRVGRLEQADQDVDQHSQGERQEQGRHQAAGHEAKARSLARPLGEQEHGSTG